MKKVLALVLALLLVLTAGAAVVKPNEDFYYYDSANVLSELTEGIIFYNNENLREACGAEIVVAAISTGGSLSTEEYAYQLLNEWGVGDKDKNNGFVLLMTIQDDDYYLCLGEGAERIVSAAEAKELLDTYLEPDFAAKAYDEGVRKLFEQLFTAVRDFYGINLAYLDETAVSKKIDENGWQSRKNESKDSSTTGLIVLLIAIILIVAIVRSRRRRRVVVVPPVVGVPVPPPRHHFFFGGGRPPMGGGHRPGGGSRSGGFGGASRSSGASRSGGFGGSSRSGGGGHSRGGGAGRGR